MEVVKVYLPCRICNRTTVVHHLSVSDLDPVSGLPIRESLRRACSACTDATARDGKRRHGFFLFGAIRSYEDEIRAAIQITQVKVFTKAEIARVAIEKGLSMSCHMGRGKRDDQHPTCMSCPDSGMACPLRAGKKQRTTFEVRHENFEGRKGLIVSKRLESPNLWTNKKNGRRIYVNERNTWEKILGPHAAWYWGKAGYKARRRLSITRYVNSARYLLDTTNREGAAKPIEDALVNLGVLYDDSDVYIERLPIKEIVDKELAENMTVIIITEGVSQ